MDARNDVVGIFIDSELYQAVAKRFPKGVSSLIEDVTWDFLDRTKDDIPASQRGIHWERVYLPSGTEFRVRHYGKFQMAKLEGEKLKYGGKEYPSIAQMANAMRGGTNVNAWRHVEIRKPGEEAWTPAAHMRRG